MCVLVWEGGVPVFQGGLEMIKNLMENRLPKAYMRFAAGVQATLASYVLAHLHLRTCAAWHARPETASPTCQ